MMYSLVVTLLAVTVWGSCDAQQQQARQEKQAVQKEKEVAKMKITSSAFTEGEIIPKQYTCDDKDLSPALSWSGAPEGTQSFALICDDPDAPMGTWVHWVLYGISADTTSLPEGVPTQKVLPTGAKQGVNDFGRIGYGGPCPPRGPAHRYFFKLYALDTDLALKEGATKKELLAAMKGHVLADSQLMGKYKR